MVCYDFLFPPLASDLLLTEPVGVFRNLKTAPKPAQRKILIDMLETDTEIEILADLPGVRKDTIQIDVDKDTIILGVKSVSSSPSPDTEGPTEKAAPAEKSSSRIEDASATLQDATVPVKDANAGPNSIAAQGSKHPGTSKIIVPDTQRTTLHKERATRFSKRVLKLPKTADLSRAEAAFTDGVLRVTVPKRELPRPKRIRIT